MDFAKKQLLKGEKMLAAGDHNLAESSIFNMAGHIETTENLLNMVITNNRANPGNANVVMAFDRLKELKAKHNVFKQKVEDKAAQTASAKADAQADASALNDHWLPNPSFR